MKIKYSNYELMLAKLNFAETVLKSIHNPIPYISNQDLRKLLNITDWDAQVIRSLDLLKFKRIKKSIIYKISDVRNYIIKTYGPKNPNTNA